MSDTKSERQAITQSELDACLQGDRAFSQRLFTPALDLSGRDFSNATFNHCDFEDLAVQDANFSAAMFANCNLANVRFANCQFSWLRFYDSELINDSKEKICEFSSCDFRDGDIVGVNFSGNSFERCIFLSAELHECRFDNARIIDCSFGKTDANAYDTLFGECKFEKADMSGISLRSCVLYYCRFVETLFADADFSDADVNGSTFDHAVLDRAKLTGANFMGVTASGLNLAVLADYAGLQVFHTETESFLRSIGIAVQPSGARQQKRSRRKPS